MSDTPNLPARVGEIEHVAPAGPSALVALRVALAALEDQAAAIAAAGDHLTLANGYAELVALQRDLRTLTGSVEQMLVDTIPVSVNERTGKTYYDPVHIEGVGTFEVKRRAPTYKWESDALLERLVRDALVDRETGEVPDDETRDAINRVVDVIRAAAPFTPSLGWRKTVLKEMGVELDDYCETSKVEGKSIKFTGGEK